MSKQIVDGAKEYIRIAIEEYAAGKSQLTPREIMDKIEASPKLQEDEKSVLIEQLVNCIEASDSLTESGKKHVLDSLKEDQTERE